MYYSYVMGIDSIKSELINDGFIIENDRSNYMVSFPKEKAQIWEEFITQYLEVDFCNEYIADDCVVFLFHLQNGIKRYEVYNFENEEVLFLCEKLCDCKFKSIKSMLMGNHFYKEKLNDFIL